MEQKEDKMYRSKENGKKARETESHKRERETYNAEMNFHKHGKGGR